MLRGICVAALALSLICTSPQPATASKAFQNVMGHLEEVSHQRHKDHKGKKDAPGYYQLLFKTKQRQEEGSKAIGVPDFQVLTGWLYCVGDEPIVATDLTQAQSEGCRLIVVPKITVKVGGADVEVDRFIVLEQSPDGPTVIYKRGDTTQAHSIVPDVGNGHYVDIRRDTFESVTKDPVAIPADLPDKDVLGDLLREVDAYRTADGIP